jgi:hypothetical protein
VLAGEDQTTAVEVPHEEVDEGAHCDHKKEVGQLETAAVVAADHTVAAEVGMLVGHS